MTYNVSFLIPYFQCFSQGHRGQDVLHTDVSSNTAFRCVLEFAYHFVCFYMCSAQILDGVLRHDNWWIHFVCNWTAD